VFIFDRAQADVERPQLELDVSSSFLDLVYRYQDDLKVPVRSLDGV